MSDKIYSLNLKGTETLQHLVRGFFSSGLVKHLASFTEKSASASFPSISLGRPTFRKTQSNLEFSKQGVAGVFGDLPIQIFDMVIQKPDFWGRGGGVKDRTNLRSRFLFG